MNIFDVMSAGGLCVPKIQRDYVMGRPEESIRKKAEKSIRLMFDAVFRGVHDPMYFVYGMRRVGENSNELMLLDGQQRITTLVLAAWFCGVEQTKKWTFHYQTRSAAEYFMSNLMLTTCLSRTEDPWGSIMKSPWYLPSLEADATVLGVRNVLRLMSDIFRAEYAEFNERASVDIEDGFRRITFFVEDMSRLNANSHSYNETFLKMNARGLPLTRWEKMKAVIDDHCGSAVGNVWKKELEGDWAQSLWSIVNRDIDKFDLAMEGLVRMAVVIDDPLRKVNFSNEQLDEWLTKSGARLIARVVRVFRMALENKPILMELRKSWGIDRRKNSSWSCVSDASEFNDFIARGKPTILEILRYAMFCKFGWQRSAINNKRRLRMVLNVLDAMKNDDVTANNFNQTLRAFVNCLASRSDAEALQGLLSFFSSRSSEHRAKRQVAEEMYKLGLNADSVVEIEKDPLVPFSRISFLLWDSKPRSAEELGLRLQGVRQRIQRDWVGLYCCILDRLAAKGAGCEWVPDVLTPIPYDDEGRWSREILDESIYAEALGAVQTGEPVVIEEVRPFWLRQLCQLLNSGCNVNVGRGLRYYGDWVYTLPNSSRSVNSIRLDRSETEARHRLMLEKNEIKYISGEGRLKHLKAKNDAGEIVFYDVWNDRGWWDCQSPLTKYSSEN